MSAEELAEAIRRLVAELSMSNANQPPLSREDILGSSADELDAMAALALEKAASLYQEIARRKRGDGELPVQPPKAKTAAPDVAVAALPSGSWPRLSLIDAVIEYLKASKKPATPLTIWAALEAAGCEVNSETPVRSVQWALRKRLRTNDDVVHVGFGKWHLRTMYTKGALDRLLAKRAGTGGRDPSEHVAKTRAGMERARKSGRAPGAPRKLTEDKVRELRRLLREGDKPVKECCEAVGITPSLYYQNKRLVEAWREGEPWPPRDIDSRPTEGANVVSFSRRKKNETPSGRPESASYEPSKGEGLQPNPSAFEPEVSRLGEPTSTRP